MSNRYARILAAGGAAVLVAALGAPAALGAATATTWTVRPGGAEQVLTTTSRIKTHDDADERPRQERRWRGY